MNMKFWGIFLPLVILLVACQDEKKENNFVTISGQFKNATFDSVYVILNEREKGFALDFDGNFSDTIQLNDEGYKALAVDREEIPLYLMPGDSLSIQADMQRFNQTFYYKGKGADRNNYLYEKDNLFTIWLANDHLYRLAPQDYLDNITDFSMQLRNMLKEKDLEPSFQQIEQRNIYFDEFNMLYIYRDSYAYFNPSQPQLPIDFLDFNRFDLNNEEDFKQFRSYRNIISYYFDEQINRGIDPVSFFATIKSESIQIEFLRTLIQNLNPREATAPKDYKIIQQLCKYPSLLKEAKAKMGGKL